MKPKRRYSLRTLILSLILLVLILPLGGLAGLRILESFLHRQTETKLIAEGVYIRLLYLGALREAAGNAGCSEPVLKSLPDRPPPTDDEFQPQFAQLDLLSDEILPPASDGRPAATPPHPAAVEAGRRIEPILIAAQRHNLSGVRVLDSHGVVVASTGEGQGIDLGECEEVTAALQGHYASALRRRAHISQTPGIFGRAGRVRVFVALPILTDQNQLAGVVYLSRTSLSLFLDAWDSRYTVGLVALLGLTLIIGLVLSALVARPLRVLIDKAQAVAAGDASVSLAVNRAAPREAHELAEALSTMVETLKQRLGYVREFTRNVSHEFKTPLTSIRGSIELLREGWQEMSDEERERFLGIIETDVRRMDRLVGRLIELTRIELAGRSDARTEIVGLLGNLVQNASEAGAEITLDRRRDALEVGLAPDLAETLFGNLIDNAVKHGQGAAVTVQVGPGTLVRVVDCGPGISEANLDKIFERFFTTARESGGTGLGLAMVRAIAEAHGADIEVDSDGEETAFTVRFAG